MTLLAEVVLRPGNGDELTLGQGLALSRTVALARRLSDTNTDRWKT